jgi:O-antigen ligase
MNNLMKMLAVSLGFFIPTSTFMTNMVLVALLVLWSRWSNIKKLPQLWQQCSALKAIVLFLGIVSIGCLYSIGSSQEILYSLKKSAKLLIIFMLLPLFVERQWRIRAYWAFLAAVALTVLFAFLEHLHWYCLPKALFHVNAERPDVFKDTLYTTLLVAMGTFVAAQLVNEYRARVKLVVGLGIFVTFSTYVMLWVNTGRSGQLIFMGLWCLFCYGVWRIKGLFLGGAGLFVILTLAWVTPTSRFSDLWLEVFDAIHPKVEQRVEWLAVEQPAYNKTIEEASAATVMCSTDIRLSIWQAGLHMMKKRPWFGWGTGSFEALAAKAAEDQHVLIDPSVARNPHNQYLNIGIQQGILGLCALLCLFGCLLKVSRQLPPVESGVLQGTLFAMAIGCLGNSWLTDFTSGYLFIWLVSVTIAAGYQNKTRGEGHVSDV